MPIVAVLVLIALAVIEFVGRSQHLYLSMNPRWREEYRAMVKAQPELRRQSRRSFRRTSLGAALSFASRFRLAVECGVLKRVKQLAKEACEASSTANDAAATSYDGPMPKTQQVTVLADISL